jgi:hypothetical protein
MTQTSNSLAVKRKKGDKNMKKLIAASIVVVVAIAAVGIGIAAAQSPQPPTPGGGQGFGRGFGPMHLADGDGAEGPMHEYMVNAMADALGITPADFEARHDAGETAYQMASNLGIPADSIPSLLRDARAKAMNAAAADGVISQEQAEWMKSRAARMGFGNCLGTGNPMGFGGRWQAGATTP